MVVGIVVTGASSGFGRAVAERFAAALASSTEHVEFVLNGRQEAALNQTAEAVRTLMNSAPHHVSVVVCDLSVRGDALDIAFGKLFAPVVSADRIYLVNNAASLGPLAKIGSSAVTTANLEETFYLNVTSACALTNYFVNWLSSRPAVSSAKPGVIINVSSLCAIQPFTTWATYCSGKAARNMFHSTLAAEAGDSLRVLNYAPGPMDTPMQTEIRSSEDMDPSMRASFLSMHTDGLLVKPTDSAEKLVSLLLKDTYTSGAHIDFYDI